MNTETLFDLLLVLGGFGLVRCMVPGLARTPALLAIISLPAGLVLYALGCLAFLGLRLPFSVGLLLAPSVLAALGLTALSWLRNPPGTRELASMAGLLGVVIVVSLNQTVTSVLDTGLMLQMGIDLAHGNHVPWPQQAGLTLGYPLLFPFLHAGAYLLGDVPVHATQLLIFVDLCALLLWVMFTKVQARLGGWVWPSFLALLLLALFMSTTTAYFHAYYIGSHVSAALFLLSFAVMTHRYLIERDRRMLLLAALLLCGMSLARLEGPVYALLVLAALWQGQDIPARSWRLGIQLLCAVVVVNYAVIAPFAQFGSISALSSTNRVVMIAFLSAVALALVVPPCRFVWLDKLIGLGRSRLLYLILLVPLGLIFAAQPKRSLETAMILWSNLGDMRQWGVIGIAWLILLLWGLIETAWRILRQGLADIDRLFLASAIILLAMLATAAAVGTPFSEGRITSSMSRVPMHFLPLFLMWAADRLALFLSGGTPTIPHSVEKIG
ncbi:MAG: hypothetical protein HQL43_00350 [Alphaproteobacteria bacterium]|nr:hypothetical protein [Alphaproteobacteria bacterium]